MSRYPSESVARFDQQFAETPAERNGRLRERRDQRLIEALRILIADLSPVLADDFTHLPTPRRDELRRRVANALPPSYLADWLAAHRDPPVVKS